MTAYVPLLQRKLSWPIRLAWLLGAMPELIKSFVWDAFVLFYYTQVLGVQSGLNIALLVIIIVDAIADPLAGAVSDSIRRAPFGRRHTLMAAAIVPFAIGLFAIFAPPAGLTQTQLLLWLLGFGIMARVGISFYSVPAFALGGELSRNIKERALIATLRNVGNQFALILLPWIAFSHFFVPTPRFPSGQLNPAPYPGFALTAVLISIVCMLAMMIGTYRRARALESLETSVPEVGARNPLRIIGTIARAIRVTPNVGRLLALTIIVLMVNSTVSQLTLHLSTYYWKIDAGTIRNLQIAGPVSALASFALAPLMMRRFPPRVLMLGGLLGFFLFQLLPVALPLIGGAPPPGSAALGWLIVALRVLAGLSYGLYVVPFNTVIYDIGDEHEANTGQPQQGLVGGCMFIGLRAGSALTAFLGASFLQIIAFPVGLAPDKMPQKPVDELALFICAIIIVAALLLTRLVRSFQISPEKQAAVVARLEALRTARKVSA